MDNRKETSAIMPSARWKLRTLFWPHVVACFLLTSSCLLSPHAVDANICSGCYNGGKLLLPNNIFGLCRCVCPPSYKGLRCEFVGKRSVDPDLAAGNGWNALRADGGRKLSLLEYLVSLTKDRPDYFSGPGSSQLLLTELGALKRTTD